MPPMPFAAPLMRIVRRATGGWRVEIVTDESRYSSIPRDQIPVELMKETPSSSVTLVGLRHNSAPIHCGSGTLVRVENQYYILTAAHCARPLDKCDEIGIPIRRDGYPFRLPVIDPIYIGEWMSEEWGPDLAFLPIPAVKARDIIDVSNKLFYNLDRYEEEMLGGEPRIEYGLWIVIGTPAFTSNIEDPKKLEFTQMNYSAGVEQPIIKDGFDYIEVRVTLDCKDVPPNFKGVSGGGLWHAEIGRKPDGSFTLIGKPRLEGCAFYETPPKGEFVYIRCHGRRSIYERGLAKLTRMQE
jgi:hypothetical protein